MKETKRVPAHPAKMPAISHPSFAEAFRFWLKLGFISFGGPTGQIAIMQTELVEKKRWISQARFLHALNSCMLLPGPEAQQLATYIGWLLHETWGGIVAGARSRSGEAGSCCSARARPAFCALIPHDHRAGRRAVGNWKST